jgi:Pregnancy-associated plasma protein-A
MKRYRNSFFLIFSICLLANFLFAQNDLKRCATAEYEKKVLSQKKDYLKRKSAFNNSIQQCIANNRAANNGKILAIAEVIKIPVVVHIIHNNLKGEIGGVRNANITDEQIKSQIEVLNEDYRRKPNTRGFNTNSAGTDMNIEFYLAEVDPDGNLTTGIIRKYSEKQNFDPFSEEDQFELSNLSNWPSDCYLNIWTTTLANNYLGFSQFPTAKLDGLDDPETDTEQSAKIDGVYIDYRYFGKESTAITSKFYKYGRTATHEVGHWLGLIHTWGDDDCGDDYVADTPQAENANLTTVCREKFSNCTGFSTRNMIENYMDYTIDSCMNIFTKGQMERVNAVFEMSPRRKKLLECVTKLPESETIDIKIKGNPISDNLKADILFKGEANVQISLTNYMGLKVFDTTFKDKRSFPISIPVNNLLPGVYILQVIVNGQKETTRIVVNVK